MATRLSLRRSTLSKPWFIGNKISTILVTLQVLQFTLLPTAPTDEVSDTTGDAMKYYSW